LVEPDDGVAEVVAGEDLARPVWALRVDFDHMDLLLLVGADVEGPPGRSARRHRQAAERETVAEGRQRLSVEPRIPSAHQGTIRAQQPLLAIWAPARRVHALPLVGEERGGRAPVRAGARRIKASASHGGCVRAYAAPNGARRHPLDGQLVEAGQRLGSPLAI